MCLEVSSLHALEFCDCSVSNCSLIEFTVTEAFLAMENHHPSSDNDGDEVILSPASGLAPSDLDLDQDDGAFWLIEPYRSSKPLHHTGSLDHRPKFSLTRVSQTIEAFEHFVYHYSNKLVVFADLQCTSLRISDRLYLSINLISAAQLTATTAPDGKKKQWRVLFDMVTHTREG